MLTFVAAVSLALVGSFLCSIMESVLLSLGTADVEALDRKGKRAGRLLKGFKKRIDIPIAAILIVNTVAHTVGAAVAGATYESAFNRETQQMVAGLDGPGVPVATDAYLATFVYRVRGTARDVVSVRLLDDRQAPTQRTVLFPTPAHAVIDLASGGGLTFDVFEGAGRTSAARSRNRTKP